MHSKQITNIMNRVQKLTTGETIKEPPRDTPVYTKCDVLIVGAGPAGCAAATAAASLGADVILVERYGHLGGMSTGGFVLWIDRMSNWEGKRVISGYAQEILDRLPADAITGAPRELWGSKDSENINYWQQRSGVHHGIVTFSPVIDPEMMKNAYQDLLLERGSKMLLHCWAVGVIQEGPTVTGVIFESKSGRFAIPAKIIIDATGDGDLANFAGAEFESDIIEGHEIHSTVNTAFRWGGVDYEKYINFWLKDRAKFDEVTSLAEQLTETEGHPWNSPRNDVAFFMGPRFYGYDCTNIQDLTEAEVRSRRIMVKMLDFYRKNFPGFEKAWILDTAPQIGVRHSRRFYCDRFITKEDWMTGVKHSDEVGVCPPPRPGLQNVSIPLSCLIPKTLDNLFVAGRNLSCDAVSHSFLREVPVCWVMGHAAGVAAAIAASGNKKIRDIDLHEIRRQLEIQGAYLQ